MSAPVVFTRTQLGKLIGALREDGYLVVGPRLSGNAIVCGEIADVQDLPAGWTDQQAPGRYRIARRSDGALFGYTVGPHSWKRYLLPPSLTLFRADRDGTRVTLRGAQPAGDERRLALLGVRACEIAAIAIQDRVLGDGRAADPHYASRRRGLLIIAVNCASAGGTCFCASMNTGPRVTTGFDLCLTEIETGGAHRFVVESGTPAGESLLARIGAAPAGEDDLARARDQMETTARRMGRKLETRDLGRLLQQSAEDGCWDEVATRCLACGNCTLACPTCFCTNVEDVTDLAGSRAERRRTWDSCFTMRFSYLHGGSVRTSVKSRYRQWLTHKLASWIDQFGASGCVGCGRCITWCPAGIDITEVAATLRATVRAEPGPRRQ